MMLMPLMMIVGYLPSLFTGSSNPCLTVPMILGSLVMGGLALGSLFGGRNYARLKEAYEQRLKEMRKDLEVLHQAQRFYYRHNNPDLPTIFEVASRAENSRFGLRLWERRPTDGDFGILRLGVGSRPSTVVYKVKSSNEGGEDEDGLLQAAKQLDADLLILTDAPLTLALRPPPTGEPPSPPPPRKANPRRKKRRSWRAAWARRASTPWGWWGKTPSSRATLRARR